MLHDKTEVSTGEPAPEFSIRMRIPTESTLYMEESTEKSFFAGRLNADLQILFRGRTPLRFEKDSCVLPEGFIGGVSPVDFVWHLVAANGRLATKTTVQEDLQIAFPYYLSFRREDDFINIRMLRREGDDLELMMETKTSLESFLQVCLDVARLFLVHVDQTNPRLSGNNRLRSLMVSVHDLRMKLRGRAFKG